jgi:hypothetical protein
MQKALFEGRFYQTYYFANVVSDILRDQFSYIRILDDFYGNDKYLEFTKPFPKYSALHRFIEFVIYELIDEEVSEIKLDIRQDQVSHTSKFMTEFLDKVGEWHPSILPINETLMNYGIEHQSFMDWLLEHEKDFLQATNDDVSDYYDELLLVGDIEKLVEKAVNEVFFILFQNRELLLLFNKMMARQIEEVDLEGESDLDEEYQGKFASPGKLKRTNIPTWVRRAVYFRDRGLCTLCHRDLSGDLNLSNREQFDHIVPLAQGGLNDVSNIQLLCDDCNRKKSGIEIATSDYYEYWYPMTD